VKSDNRLDWLTAWRQRLIRERAKHREAIAAIDQRLSVLDDYEASLRRPAPQSKSSTSTAARPASWTASSATLRSLSEVCTGDASAAEA
jgi:hypothetical protein